MVAVENRAEYLLEQLKTQDVVRVPASEAEYRDVAPEFPGKLEYHNGEIIAMSLAKFWHEVLVNGLGFLLEQYFRNKPFLVANSNAGLQVPTKEAGYYQPDLMVIGHPPIFDVWLNRDYRTLDSIAKLGDFTLPLRDIYHKIELPINQ